MEVRKHISALELKPGDRVVSACTFEDKIIVVTERGVIYTITPRRI